MNGTARETRLLTQGATGGRVAAWPSFLGLFDTLEIGVEDAIVLVPILFADSCAHPG
jgi:hypothetical protein